MLKEHGCEKLSPGPRIEENVWHDHRKGKEKQRDRAVAERFDHRAEIHGYADQDQRRRRKSKAKRVSRDGRNGEGHDGQGGYRRQ